MSGYCKYYKQKKQVSYDSGATWQDVVPYEYQKGSLYESDSQDCGSSTIERWVNSGTTCSGTSGYDKYNLQVKQISYDEGSTWTTTSEYRLGSLIEESSTDCGYTPTTPCDSEDKLTCYSLTGGVWSKLCDGVYTIVTLADVEQCPFFSSITAATIGSCVQKMYSTFTASSIKEVTICDGVREFTGVDRGPSGGTFEECQSLRRINSDVDGVANIPESVEVIQDDCFYHCYKLNTINLPSGLTTIGDSVFAGCTSLTSITIPDSVTTIGMYAFGACSGLTSVTLSNNITTIPYDSFIDCINLINVNIPSGVTKIEQTAFYNCKSLASIIIPSGVTTIEDSAFGRCYSLQTVTIPGSVTKLGGFPLCSGLTSVVIEGGVTKIDNSAFYGCTSLTSITIPNSVTSIGTFAFSGCSGLTYITVNKNTPPTLDYYVFDGSTCPIYVPAASVETYKAAIRWSDYASRIQAIP